MDQKQEIKGLYECCECHVVWEQNLVGAGTRCPKCPSKYMKWLNYEELYEKIFRYQQQEKSSE